MRGKLRQLFVVAVLSLVVIGFYSTDNIVQARKGGHRYWKDEGDDIYNKNAGNVGIGTISPTEKLTVDGKIESATGGFKFPDGTTQTTAAINENDGDWAVVGTEMYSSVSGNLGIGTSSPNYKLEVNGPIVGRFSPGDVIIASTQGGFSTENTFYTKGASISLGQSGAIRVKFSLRVLSSTGGTAYGQIFRNGVAVGTERSTTSTTHVIFTEDIGGWLPADFCELHIKIDISSRKAHFQDFMACVGPGPYAAAILHRD